MQMTPMQVLELLSVARSPWCNRSRVWRCGFEREHQSSWIAARGQPIGEYGPRIGIIGIESQQWRGVHGLTFARPTRRGQATTCLIAFLAMDSEQPAVMLALPAVAPVDTHWFAVDELGHVAMFAAGELGPIPAVAAGLWPRGSSIERELLPQLASVDASALSYAAADVFESSQSGFVSELLGVELIDAPPRFDQSLARVLVELRTATGARERFAGIGLHVLPSREGNYAWGNIESPILRELWAEGWITRAMLGHSLEPGRMGMFRYEHDDNDDNRVGPGGLYRRVDQPDQVDGPLRAHPLPTFLRVRLAAARFDLDFRASEALRVNR